VLAHKARRDVAVGLEFLLDLSLSPLLWHVLNENVVVDLAEFSLALGLELDADNVVTL